VKYIIKDNITEIYITNRKEEKFIIKIDTEDLERVLNKGESWYVAWFEKSKGYYACMTEHLGSINGKQKSRTLLLNRFIVNAEKKTIVDHENHNTLDNRRENLRLASVQENGKNRKGKNSNNTSGYRNVSQVGKWWYVQMQINGKNTLLKKFPLNELDEAGTYAMEMRNFHYGEFQGVS
jgi:hypothetical protein